MRDWGQGRGIQMRELRGLRSKYSYKEEVALR